MESKNVDNLLTGYQERFKLGIFLSIFYMFIVTGLLVFIDMATQFGLFRDSFNPNLAYFAYVFLPYVLSLILLVASLIAARKNNKKKWAKLALPVIIPSTIFVLLFIIECIIVGP